MQKHKISIIFVNYNGEKYLGEQDLSDALIGFLETDFENFEFIFVDNNSNDKSVDLAESIFANYPNVKTKIIKNKFNSGFSGGCNQGIKFANGEYYCLVNNDDKPIQKDWLKKLYSKLLLLSPKDVVFCKKMCWDNPDKIDACGLTMNRAGLIVHTKLNNTFSHCLIWQTPVLFHRNVDRNIGGFFDDVYVILNDDTDSSVCVCMYGGEIYFMPDSLVVHKRSATMKSLPVEFVAFHGRKNTILTILKNYSLINLIKWLPVTILIYIVASCYYIFKGRPDQFKATMKAIAWNIKNIKQTLKKRAFVQNNIRSIADSKFFNLCATFSPVKMLMGKKIWPK